ncbi:MAG TPA: sensor histidine kinase [Chryseosolibacter sp.]|nr:sensor histidine kinase [Chryseosolibacter sp.]
MIEQGIAIFFAGSLMAMSIYHFILFLLFRQGKEYLYLALLCFCITLRTLTLSRNGLLLQYMVPGFSFEDFKKIEYTMVYAMIAFMPLYFRSVLPKHFPEKLLTLFVVSGGLLSGIPMIAEVDFYHQLLPTAHIIFGLEILVIIYVIVHGVRQHIQEARITLVAMAVVSPIIVYEMLSNSGIVPKAFTFMLEGAVLLFLTFQAYILAKRNAHAYELAKINSADLERAIKAKTDQLIESNRLKNTLLSIITHDVKSPLNSIRGVLELMNSGLLKPDELKPVTIQLEDQVRKTNSLVENILQWSASHERSIQVAREEFHLKPLVDECLSLFNLQAKEKKVKLINPICETISLYADQNILRMVIRNLVSNALKFSNEGGFINVTFQAVNGNSFIAVEDNGIGIASEKIEHLFDIDKNFSSIGTKDEVGTGLGLSLCKKYLEAMGADIYVKSRPGQGSQFVIDLKNSRDSRADNDYPFLNSKVA